MTAESHLSSLNPATGELVGKVPVTAAEALGGVIAKARAAQPAWAALTLEERVAAIAPAGPVFTERADELADVLTREMGKPLREARGEVRSCSGLQDECQEMAEALAPEVREDAKTRSTLYRDPYGVAAVITPWNYPIGMPHGSVIPALMAGNAVVLKPSENTPLIAQAWVDIVGGALAAAGHPEVLQVVHGDGEQGRALVAGDVDLVVFTGSRDAGKHILASASKDLKRVILELGGKDPLVVLADADLDAAAKYAATNSFRNAGQVCISTERIYVDASVHDAFVDKLIANAGALKVGNGLEEGVRVGPMITERQRTSVAGQVDAAIEDGARVAWKAETPDGSNYYPPTILTDLNHQMTIARDETFGPIACVFRTDSDEEAVQLANDTPYGLGASVYGEAEHASRIARRLTAGMIGVNQGLRSAPGCPWVGARESGYGYQAGPEGHRQFAQVRVVSSPR